MARFIFPNNKTTGRSVALATNVNDVFLTTWPSSVPWWYYSLGATNLGQSFNTGVSIASGLGFSAACADSTGNVWATRYERTMYELPSAAGVGSGAIATTYTLPTGKVFTGCAFSSTQSTVYAMSSDGAIYTPNASTKLMDSVGQFTSSPCWTMCSSGSTLFTISAGTTLHTFTLSSPSAGTQGQITTPLTNLVAISAAEGYVAIGGYAKSPISAGFTSISYNTFAPIMLGINKANNTVQLWADTYGENWALQTSLSLTSPVSCAWASQNTALVSFASGVQVVSRNNALISAINTIALSSAGSLAISVDGQTALVCQSGGSNSVAVLSQTNTIWSTSGATLALTNPTFVVTAALNALPVAFIGYNNGIALAQFINNMWVVSNTVPLPYTPSSIDYDNVLQTLYVCGTTGGSGYVTVLDSTLKVISTFNYVGSADSLIETGSQIAIADSVNGQVHVSNGGSIINSHAMAGVKYLALSAITLMASDGSTTNLYRFTAPYQIEQLQYGQVGYLLSGSTTWKIATLPTGHIPTALGFDTTGICWAATNLNGIYQVNSLGAIVASGYQTTQSPQPETTPLGIATLQFWNNRMYGGQSLYGSLIEGVAPTVIQPPLSPIPGNSNFLTGGTPITPITGGGGSGGGGGTVSPPAPPSQPPTPPPIPNYHTGVYFDSGASSEGYIKTFETTTSNPASTLYSITFGAIDTQANFSGSGSQVANFNNTARKIVFGFPLCWLGVTPAQIAAGSFDATINSLLAGLLPYKGQIFSFHVGWHPNGSEGLPWQNVLPTDYVAAFRHVVTLIRAQFATTPITWGVLGGSSGGSLTSAVLTSTAQTTWPVPAGVTKLLSVECWGSGGQGGNAWGSPQGGGAGAYAAISNLTVTAGSIIAMQIGKGGNSTSTTLFSGGLPGTDTWFQNVTTVLAKAGGGGSNSTTATNNNGLASASIGTLTFDGGSGRAAGSGVGAGGGGGAGGPDGAGIQGATGTNATAGGAGDNGSGGSGGVAATAAGAVTGGNGVANVLGGGGGGGAQSTGGAAAAGGAGGLPGGGGGGGNSTGTGTGGFGADGQIKITYSVTVSDPTTYYPGDDVVDIIGSDIYESVLTSYTIALNANGGLNFLSTMSSATSGVNATVSGGHKIISLPLWSATGGDAAFITSMAGWINTNMALNQSGGFQNYDNTVVWQPGTQSLVNFGTVTGNTNCLVDWEVFWGSQSTAPPVIPPPPPTTQPPAGPPPPTGRSYLVGFYLSGPAGNISTWLGYHPDYTINGSFQVHSTSGAFFLPTGTGTPYPIVLDIDMSAAGYSYSGIAAGTFDGNINATLGSIATNSLYTAGNIYAFRIDSSFNKTTAWSTAGVATYIAAFNHVATLVHSKYPNAKIIFNPIIDPGLHLSGDATTVWPSSADIFGVDVTFNPLTTGLTSSAAWTTLFGSTGTTPIASPQAGTLGYYINFAKTKTKPFMFATWSDLYQTSGDFTAFNNVMAVCNTASNNVVGATYWDSSTGTTGTAALSTGAQNLMTIAFKNAYNGTFWTFITPPTNFAGY